MFRSSEVCLEQKCSPASTEVNTRGGLWHTEVGEREEQEAAAGGAGPRLLHV